MEGTNEQFMPGDLVHYIGSAGEVENGIVKSTPPESLDIVFVVYKCKGEWDRYQDYTAQATNVSDLHTGWFGGETIKPQSHE